MPSEIAGYPLPDNAIPFPGGTTYATVHPTTGAPVLLRVFRADWLPPADGVDAFAARMRTAFGVSNEYLVKLIDAGLQDGQPYAVTEKFDGATLETLVKDIGPMPTFLAAKFARHAALALDAIHDRGLVHGDVRPAHLVAGPLMTSSRKREDGTPSQRPGPDAVAKLSDFGLAPLRPPGVEWAALDPLATKVLAFLPPERVTVGTPTPAGDLYALGATLFFLLTGRAPFVANSAAAIVDQIASNPPAPLATLRPDLPVGLVDLIAKLLSKNPGERPATAADVAGALVPYTEPDPVPLTPAPSETTAVAESHGGWSVQEFTGDHGDHVTTFAPEAVAAEHHDDFAAAHRSAAAEPTEKPKSRMTDADRQKLKTWFLIGGVFWGVAFLLWIVLLSQNGCLKGGNGGNNSKPDDKPTRRNR